MTAHALPLPAAPLPATSFGEVAAVATALLLHGPHDDRLDDLGARPAKPLPLLREPAARQERSIKNHVLHSVLPFVPQ